MATATGMPRPALALAVVVVGVFSLISCTAAAAQTHPKSYPSSSSSAPNIVLFFLDDLGVGDVSSFGSPSIFTPHIDSVARNGVTFHQFYSANAVCTPSRAGLLTGRSAERLGIYGTTPLLKWIIKVFFPFHPTGLPDVDTIPRMLKRAATPYRSMLVGKWHLGHKNSLPTQRGFDSFYGIPYSNDMDARDDGLEDVPVVNRIVPPVPLYANETIVEQPIDYNTATARFTDRAKDFITSSHEQNSPFFLKVAYYQPHVPLEPAPEFKGKSPRGPYGDVVLETDASIGSILAHLDTLGITNNTLVIVTSDNGPWLTYETEAGSTAGFRGGKGTTFEGGVRVPTVAQLPGTIPAGTRSFAIGSALDFYATFAQLAGVPLKSGEAPDSYSIVDVLTDPTHAKGTRDVVYYYTQEKLCAVRKGAFKAIYYSGTFSTKQDPPLLYNLEVDPFEEYELDLTQYASTLNEITTLYDQRNKEVPPAQPALLNQYDLFGGPCCNPFPLKKPCYCTNIENEGPEAHLQRLQQQAALLPHEFVQQILKLDAAGLAMPAQHTDGDEAQLQKLAASKILSLLPQGAMSELRSVLEHLAGHSASSPLSSASTTAR